MLRNLLEINDKNKTFTTDVCIIGAGVSGLYLANKLLQSNIKCTLIEAGDVNPITPKKFGLQWKNKGSHYYGASLGRSFGIGGTSALWGGQMIPLDKNDTNKRSNMTAWPIKYSDLIKHYENVKILLGLSNYTNEQESQNIISFYPLLSSLKSNFNLKLSQWISFKKRNFSKLFFNLIFKEKKFDIWINSIVKNITRNKKNNSLITKAESINNNSIQIFSKYVVIAAGALESTKLVLEFDKYNEGFLKKHKSPVGNYFSDHLSISLAELKIKNLSKFNKEFSPIFDRSIMRTPRLELSSKTQKKFNSASAFAHFVFTTKEDTGLDVIKNFLKQKQNKNIKFSLKNKNIIRIFYELFQIFYWRFFYKRLKILKKSKVFIQIDVEQKPNIKSHLFLTNSKDNLGRKILGIDWKISSDDINLINHMINELKNMWKINHLNKIADLKILNIKNLSKKTKYDVYHPTGTLRMGDNIKNSVVDYNLRVWGKDDLFVTSTAVFPSAGSANPGLTHLALTDRLSEHLISLIK